MTRGLAGYNSDATVFGQAHREVKDHVWIAARNAEVPERGHVEAARGRDRDRLETAKRVAAQSIDNALAGPRSTPFTQAFPG